MSAEMLTTLLTGLGLLLSFAGAFGWMIHRMDAIAHRLDARITSTRDELKEDNAELRTEFKHDLAALRTEIKLDITELRTELKHDIAEVRNSLTTTTHELSEMRVSGRAPRGPYSSKPNPAPLIRAARKAFTGAVPGCDIQKRSHRR